MSAGLPAIHGKAKTSNDTKKFEVEAHRAKLKCIQEATVILDHNAAAICHSLKLPFVVHPYAITDASHRHIRRVLAASVPNHGKLPNTSTSTWTVRGEAAFESVASSCCVLDGEIYADIYKGNLRLWTRTFKLSPLYLYRDAWRWAEKHQNQELFLATNGLVALQTDIPWPSLDNFV